VYHEGRVLQQYVPFFLVHDTGGESRRAPLTQQQTTSKLKTQNPKRCVRAPLLPLAPCSLFVRSTNKLPKNFLLGIWRFFFGELSAVTDG